MNILIAGATGLIGSRLESELRRRGHTLSYVVRPGEETRPIWGADARCVCMDYADTPRQGDWRPALAQVDVVINAVGIFRQNGRRSFDAIHAAAPMALFQACAEAGVGYVVQLSALGADPAARSAYHLSKRAADECLRSLPLDAAIVQPSLVYAREGKSARFFRMLASLPVLPLPGGGVQKVQPVHIDDVVTGIANLVEQQAPGVRTIAFTGARAVTLREYLGLLRHGMGLGRQWLVAVPGSIALAFAGLAGRLPGNFIDAETLQMLERGNVAPNQPFAAALGHAPQDPQNFITPREASGLLAESLLDWSMPALRYVVAGVWIWTGLVSLWLYPSAQSYALLAQTGFSGGLATFLLYSAGALDLLLGLLTLALARRWRPWLWMTQLGLILFYTLVISMRLPEFWLHPYGPILKNLPLLLVLLMLWVYESRSGDAR